ncbi:MAG: tetratricopeptide repeat protein [Syntrophobacteraceae bacterium]
MEMALWNTGFPQGAGQDWIRRGEEAQREGNHCAAQEYFDRAILEDPFNARAYTKLSVVFWAQGKKEDSLNALLKALELEPGDRETVLECARVFAALGKQDFAKEVLEAYLGRNPQDAEIRSRLDAVSTAPVEGQVPDTAEFLNRQGEIQYGRGNVAHAKACFEMAIEENPLLGEAYNNLGVIELESGKTIEALKNFHKAIELRPEDGKILLNSARGLAMAAQVDAAIEVYRAYLQRFPSDDKAWEQFEGLIRQSVGSSWKPEGLSEEIADIYRHAAEELWKAGDMTGAAEAVEKALRIKSDAPDSLYLLACLHSALGQTAEAGRALDRALTIDPAHSECSLMRQNLF